MATEIEAAAGSLLARLADAGKPSGRRPPWQAEASRVATSGGHEAVQIFGGATMLESDVAGSTATPRCSMIGEGTNEIQHLGCPRTRCS